MVADLFDQIAGQAESGKECGGKDQESNADDGFAMLERPVEGRFVKPEQQFHDKVAVLGVKRPAHQQ